MSLDVHVRLSVYERMGLYEEPSSPMQPEQLVTVFTSQQAAKEGLLSLLPNKQRHMSARSKITVFFPVDFVPVPNAFSKVVQ